jgi:hypothetical protein
MHYAVLAAEDQGELQLGHVIANGTRYSRVLEASLG